MVQETLTIEYIIRFLPNQSYVILSSFLLFNMISWGVGYFIAPSLIKHLKKHSKLCNSKYAKVKLSHRFVSMVNAIITGIWSAHIALTIPTPVSVEERVFGYSQRIGSLLAFTAGFFTWELFAFTWWHEIYRKDFYYEHLLVGMVSTYFTLKPFVMYHIYRFILLEFTTIIIEIHWFIDQFGLGSSKLSVLLNLQALFTFFVFRWGLAYYFSILMIRDFAMSGRLVPLLNIWVALFANVASHLVNIFLLYKFSLLLDKSVRILLKDSRSSKPS